MKIFLLLFLAGAAHADVPGPFLNLTGDLKPRQVGDIVTVIVMEDSRAGQTANTASSRTSTVKGAVKAKLGATALPMAYDLNNTGNTASSGGGNTQRTAYFTAKVGATVKEVLPGGNMRISGAQTIKVNRDEQKIEVSGIVRPQDISQENTVLSFYLAEADIKYTGKGVLAKRQRRGLFNFLLGWIF